MSLNQSQRVYEYNDTHRPKFNEELFVRHDDDIINALKNIILSIQRDSTFTIKVTDFEVIDDYDDINHILWAYEDSIINKKSITKNGTEKKKTSSKKKQKDNQWDFINLKDSDIKLLKVTYFLQIYEKKDGIVLDKADVIVAPDVLEKGAKELNDVDVYCIYDKLDRWQQIQPIVEQIIRLKRQVILFYNELSMDILQNLQLQIVRGYADIIPIRLGSLGVQTRNTMSQISKYTGATLIDGIEVKLPKNMKDINIGKLDYVLLSLDTVIINNRDFDRLDEITLPTRSVIIRVGGANIAEVEENYRRIEDAVNSLGNAIESGISIGAGLTYQRLALSSDSDTPQFILDSLESIYRRVIYNITGEEDIPEDRDGLVPSESGSFALADELKVFDATKVIEQVIINSFSLVSQIITTEVIIAESVR